MAQQAQQNDNKQKPQGVAPTENERKALKERIKIMIHEAEQNLSELAEFWMYKYCSNEETLRNIKAKRETYLLLLEMYKSYEHTS